MEVQLQDLLATIKKDGVDSAEQEAKGIIVRAEAEAKTIVATAEKRAADMLGEVKQDVARFEASAKAAVSQAGRDLLISVQEALQAAFDRIVQRAVAENFSQVAFTDAIVSIVKAFQFQGELEVPQKVLKDIESNLQAQLGAEIKAGLELKVNPSLSGGFILREKDGRAYYDFSAESIAEAIKASLNQQFADLVAIKQ